MKWKWKRGCFASQSLYFLFLVRGVVVHDAMNVKMLRRVFIESLEKFQELLMTVARQALADDFAL